MAPASGTVPFTVGFALKQGDVPSGQHVGTSLANAQAVIKNTWPDGSAKFAVISGRATVAANTALVVNVSATGTAPSTAKLTTANLQATGITASIACGGYGTATWSGADWLSPALTWIEGPEMSSWTYRKAVGSDAHLVAWLEVRMYATGAVEVLPWIENGYLKVASPSARSATYVFVLGGTERFNQAVNLLNHQRTPLVSGATLSHWFGSADPGVIPRPDAAYLQSTRLVPTYVAQTPSNAAAVTSLPGSFTPLQAGGYPSGMGTAGYHGSIGLLPEWDVVYLTSSGAGVWAGLQRNAYSAGRYGIHFRDEATFRPARFSQHTTLVLDGSSGVTGTGSSTANNYTPSASGGTPPTYASSHCPSMGYLAYLLTGRLYHLETTQFQAITHYLKNSDNNRQGAKGVMRTDAGANTTRGAAWALRTLSQAAAITPDGDVMQAEFVGSVEGNVDFYHGRYVAMSNNPQGWVKPYSDYTTNGDGQYFEATWMQDFFTAALGMMKALGLPISATARTKLDALFAWKALSIVGRFGGTGASEFLYRDAAQYTISVAPSDSADFDGGAGPWHANWGSVYAATVGGGSKTEGDLRGGYFPDATSYWGNLQPALAYAVEHGVPGAQSAYNRMTGASNWPQMVSAFNADPVWGVRPR